MKIKCDYWRECGNVGGGCCKLGEHEKPSYHTCSVVCKKNTEKRKAVAKKDSCKSCKVDKLKRFILGGTQLIKSELGIDAADEETMAKRKAICLACESYDFGVCTDCSCFTAAKVKLKTGSPCPQGKW